MRICVVGAGAIGGLLAVRLANKGHQVSVIVRGANLAAIRGQGMALIEKSGERTVVKVQATDRIADAGKQDLVIVTLKAHQLAAVADQLDALMEPHTTLVTAQNGVPWWYFEGIDSPWRGRQLRSVDPDGRLAAHIDWRRVIGAIVYPAAEVSEPGVIRHLEGDRFSLGEPDGSSSPRINEIVQVLRDAGFKVPISKNIRAEIWVKLWGNCTFNPISALTHATLAGICRFGPTRELSTEMMREAQQVAERLSIRLPVTIEKRIAGAEAIGEHKTSMLQDVESGRPIELEALLGSVIELAEITEVSVPHLKTIYALTRLLAKTLQTPQGIVPLRP